MAMDHYIVKWALTLISASALYVFFSRLVNTQHWEHTWAVEASSPTSENIYLPLLPSVIQHFLWLNSRYETLFFLKHLRVVLQVEFLKLGKINVQGNYYMQGRMKARLGRGRS